MRLGSLPVVRVPIALRPALEPSLGLTLASDEEVITLLKPSGLPASRTVLQHALESDRGERWSVHLHHRRERLAAVRAHQSKHRRFLGYHVPVVGRTVVALKTDKKRVNDRLVRCSPQMMRAEPTGGDPSLRGSLAKKAPTLRAFFASWQRSPRCSAAIENAGGSRVPSCASV